jgi:hypothetical protein
MIRYCIINTRILDCIVMFPVKIPQLCVCVCACVRACANCGENGEVSHFRNLLRFSQNMMGKMAMTPLNPHPGFLSNLV